MLDTRRTHRWVAFAAVGLLSCRQTSLGTPDAGAAARTGEVAPSAIEPAAVAPFPAPHGPRAYVSNEASGDLSVIDLATNSVVATVRVGKRPRGVHPSPDGRRIYVALSGSVAVGPNATGAAPPADKSADGIGVVDTNDGTLRGRLPSGSDPEQFALDKEGKTLFVSNEDAASLSLIDIAAGTMEASVKVGEEPEGVAISPDGRWVYVTCETAATVDVVDVAKRAIAKEIHVGPRPRAAAFLPDSSKAYVTSEMAGTVSVIALPQHDLIRTIKLEGPVVRPMGIAIAPDGARAYVTTGHGGSVVFIDTAQDRVANSVAIGGRPWGVAISADGKTLYTANGTTDEVSVIDTASAAMTARIKVGAKPWGIAIVP